MNISQKAIDMIIGFEVSSEAVYNQTLKRPIWPEGDSGVTVGIGYDLGYVTANAIKRDWAPVIGQQAAVILCMVAGLKGHTAKQALQSNGVLKAVSISYNQAKEVFTERSLPKFYNAALEVYPGMDQLTPNAQGALTSLIFNRGSKMTDAPGSTRRIEMREIKPLVLAKDYTGIAQKIREMKRLWPNVKGLRDRRGKEADLVLL